MCTNKKSSTNTNTLNIYGKEQQEKIFSLPYLMDIAVNLFLYIVHFQLMLWSTNYVLNQWHVSMGTAGLASGIFIVGALVARIPAGRYIDYIGRHKIFLIGTILYFVLLFGYETASSLYLFMIIRFIHGVAFGMSSTAASTIVATLLPQSKLGEGIGYFTLGVTIASAIGPFLALSFTNNPSVNIYICFGLTLLCVLMAFFIHAPEHHLTKYEIKDLHVISVDHFFSLPSLRISVIAMLGGICYSTVLSFLGAYTDHLGLRGFGTTFFFIFFAITSFVSRPLTGRLLDNRGGNIVLYPSLVFSALSMFMLAVATNDVWLLGGALMLGAGYGTITAACHALAVHCASTKQVGVATSTYFVLLDAGIGVGPYLLGNIVTAWGFSAVYETAGIISIFGILLYYILLGRNGRFTIARMRADRELKTSESEQDVTRVTKAQLS